MTTEPNMTGQYQLAQEQANAMRRAADVAHEEATEIAEYEYQLAITAYHKVVGPAEARREAAYEEARAHEQGTWEKLWGEEMARQKEMNAFMVDLLSDPERIEEKLRAKIAESSDA